MPWRLQAMKDVVACEKLRGAGKQALIRRYLNGETRPLLDRLSCERSEHKSLPCNKYGKGFRANEVSTKAY
jgi:hypothetical protein